MREDVTYAIETFPHCDDCGRSGTVWCVEEKYNTQLGRYEKFLTAILCEECNGKREAQEAG